jgi:hypothetical protein
MRKFAWFWTVVCTLGGAGSSALARDDDTATGKTGVSTPAQINQVNKQIGFIDLYLTSAMNDTKVLSLLAEGEATGSDKALVAEAQKQLSTDIDRGLTHVQRLRSFKSELSAASGLGAAGAQAGRPAGAAAPDKMSRLDDIERQLRDGKSAAAKLGQAKIGDLASAVDGVATHLLGADAAFRDIAKWTNYTRLASTNLGTVPVKGSDSEAAGTTRSLDEEKNEPAEAGGETGAAPTRGAAPGGAPKPEPTQPAPGGPPK